MTLRQLEQFLEMVACGSINKAASSLGLTQQSLQASLNGLEKSLGFALFCRSRKGLELTPQGREILPEIRQIVSIARKWSRFKADTRSRRATIRIVGTVTMINLFMEQLALYFKEKYPAVALEVTEAFVKEAVQAAGKGAIGIFGSVPPVEVQAIREQLNADGLEMEIIGRDDYRIFINSAHPLASREHIRLKDLAQFTPALYPGDDRGFYYSGVFRHFSGRQSPYYASKQDSLLKLVGRDTTLAAVFPGSAIRNPNVPAGSICACEIGDFPMPGLVCLAWPQQFRAPSVEAELVAQIRRICSKRTPGESPLMTSE